MKFLLLLLLVVWTDGAPRVEDLSGKMFSFPVQNNRAHVRLNALKQDFSAATVCHRSFTDLKRDHALFSLSTPSNPNAFLIFWNERSGGMESHILSRRTGFAGFDYKLNTWHSICTTFDSTSGMTQLWFDGKPSVRKFASNLKIKGSPIIILGQEQDSYGGKFNGQQSFVGMMCDVHVWDYVLSGCEIKNYVDELNFTPGNVLNWRAMKYQIVDKVLLEEKTTKCY